jgi:predicted component of viral defense system (DUF524 family)
VVQALHRVKFAWDDRTSIEIEWSKGRGAPLATLPGAPYLVDADEEGEPDTHSTEGVPAMCWREDAPVLFERFQMRENTEYYLDITLPITRAEAQSMIDTVAGWPFGGRIATVFKADPPRRWKDSGNGLLTIGGQLRLRNHAGILNLSVSPAAPLSVEVACRKIGYFDEFQALLDAVAEELSELLLQYDSPTSASFNLSDTDSETEAALLFQLRYIMADRNMGVALDEIGRAFHSQLEERYGFEEISLVEEPDIVTFLSDFDGSNLVAGGPLRQIFRGYTPRSFPVVDFAETTDTTENRYVKAFLDELRLIAQRLKTSLDRSRRVASSREVGEWINYLDDELSSDLWRSVGPLRTMPSNSQVLEKRSGYREILKYDLSLRLSLELPWKQAERLADGLVGDIRPVSELYEYWCFFQLRGIIAELTLEEISRDGSFIDVTKDGLQVRLSRGKRSRVSYLYRRQDEREVTINLYYNRTFARPSRAMSTWHGSYTARFDPDYSIEVVVSGLGSTQRHWLHFDAKYRLDRADRERLFAPLPSDDDSDGDPTGDSYERELNRVYKQDDLFKMHTYRDGILGSRGAYILFPGDGIGGRLAGKDKSLFVRHPSAFGGSEEFAFPSVGAFDLCPGGGDGQRQAVREFLGSVLDAVFAGRPYREEEGLF